MTYDPPLRLVLDRGALVANWRALAKMAGAPAGAAVKADGYGLGARAVADALVGAGCRDLFVATWGEALALGEQVAGVSVLHGVRPEDMALVGLPGVRPVLNTPAQVQRWRQAGGGLCDVMVDTGMNRLGVSEEDIATGLLDGLEIDLLMSHLACADEDSAMNGLQRHRFAALSGRTGARRMSLANSAGIALGKDYAFDLVRPGLALYGGIPRPELEGVIAQVVRIEAQILQRRTVLTGEPIGYNATWIAPADTEVAIINLGYADGYWRAFSGRGMAHVEGQALPVLGRVSMDLTAIDVTAAKGATEGEWLSLNYELPTSSKLSGMSQYELLTGLRSRFKRSWASLPRNGDRQSNKLKRAAQ